MATASQILDYALQHHSAPDEYVALVERLAPVLLDDPAVLAAAIRGACDLGLAGKLWQRCQDHAAETRMIDAQAADDARWCSAEHSMGDCVLEVGHEPPHRDEHGHTWR